MFLFIGAVICTSIKAIVVNGCSKFVNLLLFINLLIHYSRASSKYVDFVERGILLSQKLLRQANESIKLRSSLRKFYGRHHQLIGRYDKSNWYSSSVIRTCHHYRTEQRNNTTGAIYGAGNAYPSGALDFTSGF